jgi:glucose dehydrogenase
VARWASPGRSISTPRGQEATPLMHDGVLYTTTAWSMVKAYDAAPAR